MHSTIWYNIALQSLLMKQFIFRYRLFVCLSLLPVAGFVKKPAQHYHYSVQA